eukprot:scaffold16745_cov90-Skeletonema_dohrnii-CCMP3373.AAC.2
MMLIHGTKSMLKFSRSLLVAGHNMTRKMISNSSELRVAGRRSLGVVAILMGRSMSWPPPIPCPIQCRAISLLGDGSWEGQMGAR